MRPPDFQDTDSWFERYHSMLKHFLARIYLSWISSTKTTKNEHFQQPGRSEIRNQDIKRQDFFERYRQKRIQLRGRVEYPTTSPFHVFDESAAAREILQLTWCPSHEGRVHERKELSIAKRNLYQRRWHYRHRKAKIRWSQLVSRRQFFSGGERRSAVSLVGNQDALNSHRVNC